MRFSLAYVDYEIKKRKLRPSSFTFKAIAENKELLPDIEYFKNKGEYITNYIY